MHRAAAAGRVIAAGLALSAMTLPTFAAPSDYDLAFVAEFERACVPGRLTYETSLAAVEAAGWLEVGQDAHPELDSLMMIAEREATAVDELLVDANFDAKLYGKDIAGRPHFLVVSRASAVIGEPDDPLNPWVFVGCYLYDFDATQAVDPAAVTALIGNPISHSVDQDGVTSHVWGPPCPMPRTGDTYLTYIADDSELVEQTRLFRVGAQVRHVRTRPRPTGAGALLLNPERP